MSKKNNVVEVSSLINEFDKDPKSTNAPKVVKGKDEWGNAEEDYGGFNIVGNTTSSAGKSKTKSKKNQEAKGWGDLEQPAQKPAEPEPSSDFTEKKPKVMKKIGEPRPTEVKFSENAFPELGAEPVKVDKKEEVKVEQPQSTSSTTTGPRKFVNANKNASGENFAPIEATVDKTPQPQPQQIQQTQEKPRPNVFSRAGETKPTTEEPPVEDSKFKFGSSGNAPRFTSSKGATKVKEEEKSEQDLNREKKEREIEEKLQKERDEVKKQIEEQNRRREKKLQMEAAKSGTEKP